MSNRAVPREAFTIAIISVKPLEVIAMAAMLDEIFTPLRVASADKNQYILGRIGHHNVVIASPPQGSRGKVAAAAVAGRMPFSFPNVTAGMLVGIGGGAPHLPKHDVRLGDVVVGAPEYGPAAVQYDLGKQTETGYEVSRTLDRPPEILVGAVNTVLDEYLRSPDGHSFFQDHLKRFARNPQLRSYSRPNAQDRLFDANYGHDGKQCSQHSSLHEIKRPYRDPRHIHFHSSTILSGDGLVQSAKKRDELSRKHHHALCFEKAGEAAGAMNALRCLPIRGICDYADSHGNGEWQGYAAATAAAYARQLLLALTPREPNIPYGRPAWEKATQSKKKTQPKKKKSWWRW